MTSHPNRIAIFVPSLKGGGAERVAVIIANGLAQRGHDVHLLAGSLQGPALAEVTKAVSTLGFGRQHMRSCVIPLARWLREFRPQVLLSLMAHANMTALAASALAHTSHRLVVSERTVPSAALATEFTLKGALIANTIRYTYRFADAVVAVSETTAHDLCTTYKVGRAKVKVIYNPVDVEKIRQKANDCTTEASRVNYSGKVVIAVARLTAAKDHMTLLRAIQKLREKIDVKLILVGDGELKSKIGNEISRMGLNSAVELTGYVPNPFHLMAQADCFVLSSVREGFPNVLVEAAAVGTPIVATDCPGASREILDGVDGAWLVAVGDIEGMSAAIAGALSISKPVTALMRRAAEFSVERAISAYESVLGLS